MKNYKYCKNCIIGMGHSDLTINHGLRITNGIPTEILITSIHSDIGLIKREDKLDWFQLADRIVLKHIKENWENCKESFV